MGQGLLLGLGLLLAGGYAQAQIGPNDSGAPLTLDRRLDLPPAVVQSAVQSPMADISVPTAIKSEASLFQQFVARAVGVQLPVFGADFFSASNRYSALTNIAPPDDYVLGPGDEVQLQLWGSVDLAAQLVVDRSGLLMVPKVGPLAVTGMRAGQLRGALKAHVGKVFKSFDLTATVSRVRSIQVYVVGQAQRPGTYTLSSLSTLVNALFASGGPSSRGSMRGIEVRRANQTIKRFDVYDFVLHGDQSQDVHLQSGDVIVIPPIGPQVAVAGFTDHAAIYEIRGQTTIASLMEGLGGVSNLVETARASLERIAKGPASAREIVEVALDDQGLSTVLRDGDILTLQAMTPAFRNDVTLQGPVARAGRAKWFEGMRLLDLIPTKEALISPDYFERKNRGGLSANARTESAAQAAQALKSNFTALNWDYAVIERLDRELLKNELISFDLGALVLEGDSSQNLELRAGDVVTVFSQADLQVPTEKQYRLVRVEGEVASPGIYSAQLGETLPQLLRRVGGLSSEAYLYGTEFTRASVRRHQQANLDQLVHALEADLEGQVGLIAGDARISSNASAQLAATERSQAVAARQLERLKSMRSSGRVALELAPEQVSIDALPDLTLEDGDRIVVPTRPSFVGVFGAVSGGNVIVYRPGRTVHQVLALAGPTDAANLDSTFVVRADGTVVSKQTRDAFLSLGFEQMALAPGDTVVVPYKVDRESIWAAFMRNAIDITQVLANLGLGVAALNSL